MFTTTELFAVHPFDGLVTVKVYVPAALTVGVAVVTPETIPGPVQLNVAPLVLDEPLSVTEVTEHVNVCDVPAFAFGAPAAELTLTVFVAVQPFAGSVTVTVYVPATLTVGLAVEPPETIPGPLQLKVAPLVEDEPLRVADVAVQLKVCGAPAFALGAEVFEETKTFEVAVHPFAGSVTVTV
jgi:hypothetical protein